MRCLLVPSVMMLLGRANWWLPGRLDRILPRVGLETEDALPPLPEAPVPPQALTPPAVPVAAAIAATEEDAPGALAGAPPLEGEDEPPAPG